jgi:hypothetical protein
LEPSVPPKDSQEFQCHEAMKAGVLGLVDDTHPAAAEFFNNAVMRDGLANKRIGAGHAQHILGRDMSQVNAPRRRRFVAGSAIPLQFDASSTPIC